MTKRLLATTEQVIDALGGNHAVADMLGGHHKAVANWRYFGFFPANTYLALREALKQRHKRARAPDSLWAMRPLIPNKRS